MDVPTPERILIVRLSHLGDVVHGLPVLHGLRRAFPAAQLAWVVQPEFAGLLEGVPGLDRVIPFDRRGGLRGWLRARGALRRWGPDWTVDCQGNAKSASLAWTSGARRRFGYAQVDWTEGWFARSLTDRAAPAEGLHAIDRVRALLATFAQEDLSFELGLSSADRKQGRRDLAARLPQGDSPPLLLHLGVAGDRRSWPTPYWSELAIRLADRGRRVLVLSGPGEAAVGEEVRTALSSREDIGHWIGQRGLRLCAAVLSAAADLGGRMVGTDSGPSHLAAAVGLPVVLLAGPQDPDRTGPWPPAERPGSLHRVLRARPDALGAMDELTPARVAEDLLA